MDNYSGVGAFDVGAIWITLFRDTSNWGLGRPPNGWQAEPALLPLWEDFEMSSRLALLDPYLDDVERCWGNRPGSFVCPILLEESPGIDLIDGHVLPQSLRVASRATVLQRKDVDNFFGHAVEAELVNFVNSVTYTKAEILERAKGVSIVSERAGPLPLFTPTRKSAPPYPRIGLRDSRGQTIASPYVKGTMDDLGGAAGTAEIRATMSFHKPSVDAAILKAAHLALFRIAGYQWVFSAAGRFASEPLRKLLSSPGSRSDIEALFGDFANAFQVILSPSFPFDTLTDSKVILHDKLSDPDRVDPFAISCVFTVNERLLFVTLPYSIMNSEFPRREIEYRQLTADWSQPTRKLVATLGPGKLEIESDVQMQFTADPPPELIPADRSDTD